MILLGFRLLSQKASYDKTNQIVVSRLKSKRKYQDMLGISSHQKGYMVTHLPVKKNIATLISMNIILNSGKCKVIATFYKELF